MSMNSMKILRIISKLNPVFGYISESLILLNAIIAFTFSKLYFNTRYSTIANILIILSIVPLIIIFLIAVVLLIKKVYDIEPNYDRNRRLKETHTYDFVVCFCTVFEPIFDWSIESNAPDYLDTYGTTRAATLICQWIILLEMFFYAAYLDQFSKKEQQTQK